MPLLLAACAGGDAGSAAPSEEALPNGGRLVRNGEVGAWTAGEGWRLVEDLRIGRVDGSGPDVFGNLTQLSLAVGPEGRIYVLDGQANEVRVFDETGRHLSSFGRAGAGPGELRQAAIAGFGPDGDLWIADRANARYSVFRPDGEFVTSYPRSSRYWRTPWPGSIDAEGRILDTGISDADGSTEVLLRVDPSTSAADTFPLPADTAGWFRILNPSGRPSRTASIPFAGRSVWKPDPRGLLWSATTDRYRIVQATLEGDTLLVIERAQPPVPVTAQEREEGLARLESFVAAGGTVDPSRIPSTKPPISDFMVDPEGYLWVSHIRGEDSDRPGFDVFDPDGRYLGEVTSSTPLVLWHPRPIFRNGYVYGVTMDELQVPFIVRQRIEGREARGGVEGDTGTTGLQ